MQKVLIITYYWPPSGGSGVQRWLKFAKYLPQLGWEPVVYTPLNPEPNAIDEALCKDIPEGITIIKRKIFEPYSFYKFLTRQGKNKPIEANLISKKSNKSLSARLFAFIRANFFIPDPRCAWIGPSVRYLKKYLRENPVDAIISTGPPHSMHLIAKKVSKATGIKWIADFRDPWTKIFYFKHLPLTKYSAKRHARLEREVLNGADCVITVSERIAGELRGEGAANVEVIPNGFDPADFSNIKRVETNRFLILHTGILAEDGNPDTLWRVLGEIAANPDFKDFKKELEIRVMGQIAKTAEKQISDAGLQESFVNMGYMPHSVVPSWQKSASILLLPLRKEPEAEGILTGKFFEYLASGSSILAFGPKKGDLAEALQQTKSGAIFEWEEAEPIKEFILEQYGKWQKGHDKEKDYQEHITNPDLLRYSRKEQAVSLSGILDKIIKE